MNGKLLRKEEEGREVGETEREEGRKGKRKREGEKGKKKPQGPTMDQAASTRKLLRGAAHLFLGEICFRAPTAAVKVHECEPPAARGWNSHHSQKKLPERE